MKMQQPHLKGHLSTKSSVYAVGNSKLITQRLVQDHMNVHYRKILKVKSAIDNRPPKSTVTSVKCRDSHKIRIPVNGQRTSRPASATVRSSRAFSQADPTEKTRMLNYADDLQSILSSRDIAGLDLDRRNHTTPSWSPTELSFTGTPSLNGSHRAHSSMSYKGLGGSGVVYKTGRHRQIAGDHIDRFADRFGEPKDFQPRTLKKQAHSWLGASKHYTAPPQARRETTNGIGDSMSITDQTRKPELPTGKKILIATTHSTREVHSPKVAERPPPSTTTVTKTNLEKTFSQTETASTTSTTVDKLNDDASVQFISEVTQDILDRGVFTNRAIEKIIMEHYYKNKSKISERKLQHALSSLREDFGLNETGTEKDAFISAQEHYYDQHTPITNGFSHPVENGCSSISNSKTPSNAASRTSSHTLHERISKDAEISNGDEELNETVDELIAKINDLETHKADDVKLEKVVDRTVHNDSAQTVAHISEPEFSEKSKVTVVETLTEEKPKVVVVEPPPEETLEKPAEETPVQEEIPVAQTPASAEKEASTSQSEAESKSKPEEAVEATVEYEDDFE